MSTADFDAAIERAARAMFDCEWGALADERQWIADGSYWHQAARVVLEACGWEDAARILESLVSESPAVWVGDDWHICGVCRASLPVDDADHAEDCPYRRARAWVAQYTPTSEGTR